MKGAAVKFSQALVVIIVDHLLSLNVGPRGYSRDILGNGEQLAAHRTTNVDCTLMILFNLKSFINSIILFYRLFLVIFSVSCYCNLNSSTNSIVLQLFLDFCFLSLLYYRKTFSCFVLSLQCFLYFTSIQYLTRTCLEVKLLKIQCK